MHLLHASLTQSMVQFESVCAVASVAMTAEYLLCVLQAEQVVLSISLLTCLTYQSVHLHCALDLYCLPSPSECIASYCISQLADLPVCMLFDTEMTCMLLQVQATGSSQHVLGAGCVEGLLA